MGLPHRRKTNDHYRCKVYIFIWTSIAFISGYVSGLVTSYLGDLSQKATENEKPILAVSKAEKIESFLTVGILSSGHNNIRRKVIRDTWLSKKPGHIVHKFVIGQQGLSNTILKSIGREQERFGDILLIENIPDNYQHLTKKLLKYFEWLDQNVNFTFVLKCDDDSFVQLENIKYELTKAQKKGLYWGFFDGRAKIKKRGQWAEKNWILCDRYLPYAQGGGYVLSSDIVHFVAQSNNMLMLYNSEDVSVGVWTAALNVTRIHDPRFDTEFESRGCFNSFLITHKQSPDQMEEKQENLKTNGVMCKQEFRSKKSYIYNWKTLPSLCCTRNNTKVP